MPDPYDELYRTVWFHLQGDRPRVRLREVREAIGRAHYSDRRDGVVVTHDNAGLFRMYRNNVSPDPQHLIAAAKAHAKEVTDASE
jgi:DNA-binding transcriptional MocR family regulator